jgi:SSS family solute:Na+ symporter
MTELIIIGIYLGMLLGLGLLSNRFYRGTSSDYFLASRSIGPFLLLMSIFGTTMTAFALVGSTGESFSEGIGVYGLMASSSGIVHSACFFIVGIKLWSLGKRYGYVTQIQFFRDRFESHGIGLVLFPILVGLVVPYLLIGVIAAGSTINGVTAGTPGAAFSDGVFPSLTVYRGGVPPWAGSLVICLVVLTYVFFGGLRGAAWANAFQTIIFMALGLIAFVMIADKLGGMNAASEAVLAKNPSKMRRAVREEDKARYAAKLQMWESAALEKSELRFGKEIQSGGMTEKQALAEYAKIAKPAPPHGFSHLHFLTYMFIPLSVGMFPHLFQHWLTAKSAKTFRTAIIAHPLFIMIVWVPCVLVGAWATSAVLDGKPVIPEGVSPNAVLAIMVNKLGSPMMSGLLTAGILAAIMSSLDSQFLCLGTIFTNDIVIHYGGDNRFNDKQQVLMARVFVVLIVSITYAISLIHLPRVFTLGVWCFSGFAGLFPVVLGALYWKRASKGGAFASIITTVSVWLWLFAESDFGENPRFLFLGMMPVATIVAASAVALVVVSLVTRPPSEYTVERFFPGSHPRAEKPAGMKAFFVRSDEYGGH